MAGEIGHYCGIDFIGGGLGTVDKIDGAVLQDKDGFLVIAPSLFAPFSLDADSGAGESYPDVIAPNTNPGDKRWILMGGVFKGLELRNVNSQLYLHSIGAGADEKNWLIDSASGAFRLMAVNDAKNVYNHALNINRTGATITYVNFPNGNVGINETAPQRLLHITGVDTGATVFDGSANVIIEDTGTSWFCFMSDIVGKAGIVFGDTADPFVGSIDYNHDGDYLRFYVNNAERARIKNDGKFNITGVYEVDDVQVVGNRGAAVADATDAPSVILRLNELLARCRTHGLIAT